MSFYDTVELSMDELLSPPEATAAIGRLDGNQEVILPAGEVDLAEALWVQAGTRKLIVRGQGSRRTRLKNVLHVADYKRNCTVAVEGDLTSIGWIDHFAEFSPGSMSFRPKDGFDFFPFEPGMAFYLFKEQSGGKVNFRVTIDDKGGGTFKFSDPTQTGDGYVADCDAFKFTQGWPIEDAADGADRVTLVTAADALDFLPGVAVKVGNGASQWNEFSGEDRVVLAIEGDVLILDKPLRRAWTAACVVRMKETTDITFADLEMAQPVNPKSHAFYARNATRLTLDGVRLTGLQQNVANCGHFAAYRNDSDAGINFNSCHDLTVDGGRIGPVYFEESCVDADLRRLVVESPGGMVHGVVVNGTGCQRVRARDILVKGAGRNDGNGAGGGISGGGRECEFTDCTITASRPWSVLYLWGDALTVRNLRSDVPVVITAGHGIMLDGVRVPYWLDIDRQRPSLELRPGTSGQCYGSASDDGTQPSHPATWMVR